MPTRMERYYRSNPEMNRRTSRNEDLYKQIYESAEYSNIEGVTSIGSTNEIDITKLKEMLKNRENYQKEKEYRNIMKIEKPIEIPVIEEEEERTYDIRDILNKAKNERTEDDNKDRSLKNTQYNILKDNGKIKREISDKLALDEYKKYRVIQDKNYISDFDELITETKKLNNI